MGELEALAPRIRRLEGVSKEAAGGADGAKAKDKIVEEARDAQEADAERRAKVVAEKVPTRPGCYAYMPTGCPRHPEMATNPWYRDVWRDATVNRTTCELVRPRMVKSYCNSEEISLVFIEDTGQWPAPGDEFWDLEQQKEAARLENEAKGIARTSSNDLRVRVQEPAGEPEVFPLEPPPVSARLLPPHRKYEDASEEAEEALPPHATAGAPAARHSSLEDAGEEAAEALPPHATASAPAARHNSLEEMKTPALPSQPGCYVLTLYGCPLRSAFETTAQKFWVRDVYGEKHLGTGDNRAACDARKDDHYAKWCGVAEVRMGFVPGLAGASPSTMSGVR